MRDDQNKQALKPVEWIGSSRAVLVGFPPLVRKEMGHALHLAQVGEKAPRAKPLRGFGGASVLEVGANHEGNTYRVVYTVKFARAVFVLHAFQKKSKRGIATSNVDIDLIKARLKVAAEQ